MVTRLVVALLGIIAISGCELQKVVVPRTERFIVVHSILDPGSRIQSVLVERSLTGAITVNDKGAYDPRNPVVSGGGEPLVGADVRITDPDGVVMQAAPVALAPGLYQFSLDTYKVNLQPGRQYSLAVLAEGDTVRGTTLLPAGAPPRGVPVVPFNRDHDYLKVQINDVSFAAAYWVQILAPTQPYELFTFDRNVAIAGDVRNIFTDDLLKVFYPGFLQTTTIAAIDTNVYDYYRSGNDPFTGSGMINHLKGGLGLFGSLVIVDRRQVDVTQDSVDAIDGTYTPRGPAAGNISAAARSIRLYREALGGKASVFDRISGSLFRGPPTSSVRAAIYGTRTGDSLELDLLNAQTTGSRNAHFSGVVRGDSLIGSMNIFGNGSTSIFQGAVFVRVGK